MPPSMDAIIRAGSHVGQLAIRDIVGPLKCSRIVYVRQAVMLVASEFGHSLPSIGRSLNRDHTTVIHGKKSMRKKADADPATAEFLRKISERAAINDAPAFEAIASDEDEKPVAPPRRRIAIPALPAPAREEARRLRRIGWSINSLGRRYEMSNPSIAFILGERL